MPAEQPVPRFFLLLMAATAILLAGVIYPIAKALLVAMVLAGVLWPMQRWLTARLRGHGAVSAGVLTVAVLLVLVGPLATLITFAVRDGGDAVRFVSETLHGSQIAALLERLPASARDFLTEAIAHFPQDLDEVLGRLDIKGGTAVVGVGARVTLHTVFMLIALFFMLMHGDELVTWLDTVSPLRRGQTRELLAGFKKVSVAVVVSTLVTAAVQAVAALIGYFIARVPSPLFFALITFFVAFVPAVGAAVVCLAAALLLAVTGHPYMAIFLAAWGVGVVGLVDNIIKPLLIKRGLELHGAVVFFSLVGGIATFGSIGLLLGPLVVSLFLALLSMFHRDFSPENNRQPPVPGLANAADPGSTVPPTPAT